MPDIKITGQSGRVATFSQIQQLTSANANASLKAATNNKKDDVILSVGKDLFLSSGDFPEGFKPASAKVNGKDAQIKGVQYKRDESFGRKFLQGMNFASVRIGAGAALAGMFAGAWVAGTFFAASMPVMFGIAAGFAVAGFLGSAFYQAKSGNRLDGNSFGAPQAATWAQNKLHGR